MAASLPPLPSKYKPIQHFTKIGSDHEKRDPAVAYYCYLYALQKAMEIDKKSGDCRSYLAAVMDLLEQMKRQHPDLEAIQSEVVGQAYVEQYALKLFLHADNQDRSAQFSKALVKAFYTAGLLFDVLTQFGELQEDLQKHYKYAKWKASYIHRCLQNGETPRPGPMPEDGEEGQFENIAGGMGGVGFEPYGASSGVGAGGANTSNYSNNGYNQPNSSSSSSAPHPQDGIGAGGSSAARPPSTGKKPTGGVPVFPSDAAPQHGGFEPYVANNAHVFIQGDTGRFQQPASSAPVGGVNLKPEDYQKASKCCKYAQSALQYEDAKTAIEHLNKALKLLTTGHE